MAFLAALPLATAPILLHLFDRRRNVVIEWGGDAVSDGSRDSADQRSKTQTVALASAESARGCVACFVARPADAAGKLVWQH